MKLNITSALLFSTVVIFSSCGNSKQVELPTPTPIVENTEINTVVEMDFPTFWTNFRKAALENNFEELKKRTNFPLATRGPMDGDPMIQFSEDEFDKMFEAFLQSPTGLNPNNFNETQKQYIQANPSISFNDNKVPMMADDNTAAITSMEFKKGKNGWKLSMLYLDEETYSKSGKPMLAAK